MLSLDQKTIDSLVDEIVNSIANSKSTPKVSVKSLKAKSNIANNFIAISGISGIFEDIDSAICAAGRAQEVLVDKCSMATRNDIIRAMRKCSCDLAVQLSNMTVEETGIGRVDDKIKKNYLAANETPGCEILKPWCQTGDDGLMLTERAAFGVIAAITPCTNATETIICNAIGMLAGGNAVVFNVHPSAKKVARFLVEKLNEAIVAAGGPDNLISMIVEPTIESANNLMTHHAVRLVVVTGGSGVVKAAMSSGKRAICGGPGNPPVVVDETADIKQAARGIISGASLDNNIVCVNEKEVFCVSDVADMLKRQMLENSAQELHAYEIAKLERLIVQDGHANKDWVGKNASVIAHAIGKQVPEDTRILLCEVDGENHPFVQTELLMPVLPLVRVCDVGAGIEAAIRSEHGYKHTAGMYSTNINSLHKMARTMDCSIFIKNAPHYSGLGFGGEGYTSFTIASPTGEGLTTPMSFTRERRCTLKDYFRIV